jgi:spore maturation protein CgeB
MKSCIQGNGITYELVPPGQHRRNQAERAIQTFKHHFILILSGVDDKFPLSLWCALLKQTELTVNLLRQSNVVPKISAFAHVHGQHDYMRKPFAPLGCAVQAHVKPDARRTWDAHLQEGFNLGTSMEHHRCFKIYITKTRATRISDTVFFKHQYITNPAGLT